MKGQKAVRKVIMRQQRTLIPLASTLTKNTSATPLASTLTRKLHFKPFGINTYKKGGEGEGVPTFTLPSRQAPANLRPLLESAFVCPPTRLSPSAISQNTSAPSSAAKVFAAASSTSSIP